jgi:hypothetical protein
MRKGNILFAILLLFSTILIRCKSGKDQSSKSKDQNKYTEQSNNEVNIEESENSSNNSLNQPIDESIAEPVTDEYDQTTSSNLGETINQITLFEENQPDNVGKYFYKMFKESRKDEFEKWMYEDLGSRGLWKASQRYNNKPFQWEKTEYEKCVIERKSERSDEYFIKIYFKDKQTNENYKCRFLLMKALREKNKDEKYYFSTSYDPVIRKAKD